MSIKMLMIIVLWILGMAVDILWSVTDKEQMKLMKDAISDIDGLELIPDSLVMMVLVAIIIILSVLWPADIVMVPYKKIKKIKKKET